eukprot:4175410-Pleurochrysis_carterae.AAC.1
MKCVRRIAQRSSSTHEERRKKALGADAWRPYIKPPPCASSAEKHSETKRKASVYEMFLQRRILFAMSTQRTLRRSQKIAIAVVGDFGGSDLEERQTRVGRESRQSTRRPHYAVFVFHRTGGVGTKGKKVLRVAGSGELDLFPCVTAGEAVATRACSTEN